MFDQGRGNYQVPVRNQLLPRLGGAFQAVRLLGPQRGQSVKMVFFDHERFTILFEEENLLDEIDHKG
jgi:hypothetical protein